MISRREFLGGISAFSASSLTIPALEAGAEAAPSPTLPEQRKESPGDTSTLDCGNALIRISIAGSKSNLWSLEHRKSGRRYDFAPPSFPLEGGAVDTALREVRAGRAPEKLNNGVTEYSFEGTVEAKPALHLRMIFQLAPDNALVRFRYTLESRDEQGFKFDLRTGTLTYLGAS